jgi:iron complex outermembrane receptor protein
MIIAVGALSLLAAGFGPQAAAPSVEPTFGKAADNKIYAQQLAIELVAKNPDLGGVGLHAIPPGGKDYEIVAQLRDLIGKKSSADDVDVINRDATKIYPFVIDGSPRFSALAPLRDRAGNIIGLAVLSFHRRPGIDKLAVHTRLEAILADLAKRIPDRAALFRPIP